MSTDDFPKATSADVALLLEGTFPYVSGGVSSWVNQIIRAFPDIRFAIVFLGSRRSDYGAPKYAIPANVVHVETHFLHDDIVKVEPHAKPTPRKGDTQAYADVAKLHDGFKGNPGGLEAFARIARELASDSGDVDAARFRDAIGVGRKLAIQILEFFDRSGFLRRQGNRHLLRDRQLF